MTASALGNDGQDWMKRFRELAHSLESFLSEWQVSWILNTDVIVKVQLGNQKKKKDIVNLSRVCKTCCLFGTNGTNEKHYDIIEITL